MTARKQLSVFQKVLAAVVLLVVIIGSTLLGLAASGALFGHDAAPPDAPFGHARMLRGTIALSIVIAILSAIALVAGAAIYAVVVATRLFTFDFSRPVWSSVNSRMFLANILVDEFRVRREQLLSIERVANAGSVSAYFGNVNIILTLACEGAAPRRLRLHPESSWTMTGTARASDRLANELEQWKSDVPEVMKA